MGAHRLKCVCFPQKQRLAAVSLCEKTNPQRTSKVLTDPPRNTNQLRLWPRECRAPKSNVCMDWVNQHHSQRTCSLERQKQSSLLIQSIEGRTCSGRTDNWYPPMPQYGPQLGLGKLCSAQRDPVCLTQVQCLFKGHIAWIDRYPDPNRSRHHLRLDVRAAKAWHNERTNRPGAKPQIAHAREN